MDINKEIKKLEQIYLEKPQRVFTMYLNTDPSDPDQQGGEWKLHLKNGLNSFENYLQEDGDSDEKRNYWAVKEKVEQFMHDNEQELAKSVVIIANADESVWFAHKFQMPVKTEFSWEEQPKLEQLKEMYNQFPETGIILTQKEAIKILDTELGTLKDTKLYEMDLDTEDWREHTGPHGAGVSMGTGGKNNQQEQFESRFEANRYRWYKSIGSTLDKVAKNRNWQHIYIVGKKDEAEDLVHNMSKEVTDIVPKNMLEHEEMKIINEVVV
ncbi:VLRF1 family aeRF1-type release factor [Gracilibacillus caseinilyticus]|uniref:VLRF1 family aeRF1-type release factor n=1 Tax=Gracilibacillus caseinilyticus TaxID=2932256 RepID=A0ABY4ET00_9BACI|nr:VLRF1 family aeRF1-type release factor [Gracilibacillus caseinilyticus]UOQ46998.1 VLRF1 family aeRF1-type release factor [Gracilibacillus caseinilyticus]